MKFIFDLDGTLTECETLPLIAEKFNLEGEIAALTTETVKGRIPFVESFIKRVDILGRINIAEVASLLSTVRINSRLDCFIKENQDDCVVATGNFRGWLTGLSNKIPCEVVCSEGKVDDGGMVRLTKILKKEDVVRDYQARGEQVVFVGDGNNDSEAMRISDISIACGLVHEPALSVMQIADYAVYDATALVRLLNQIKQPSRGKSVVISAAGVGYRLGLGQTKSLIRLGAESLIEIQLSAMSHVEDIRIVVGFQAADLINEVLNIRRDIVFVFNHDYFHTKTGASLYLGAKHANELIVAWDGDLLVHPEDIEACLNCDREYVGVSHKSTEDGVFVRLDDDSNVIGFSTEDGDYEWSGPACIRREHIHFTSGHAYSQLEPLLPLQPKIINARDIDTYEDYKNAVDFIASWKS